MMTASLSFTKVNSLESDLQKLMHLNVDNLSGKSREALADYVAGKEVQIIEVNIDRYKHAVGQVYLEDMGQWCTHTWWLCVCVS